MLVLSRKVGERVMIGDSIWVTIVRVEGDRVRVGIEAPRQITVLRQELATESVTHSQIGNRAAVCRTEPCLAGTY